MFSASFQIFLPCGGRVEVVFTGVLNQFHRVGKMFQQFGLFHDKTCSRQLKLAPGNLQAHQRVPDMVANDLVVAGDHLTLLAACYVAKGVVNHPLNGSITSPPECPSPRPS